MKKSGIYKIESKIKKDRIYIGGSDNIDNRCRYHFSLLKNNKHYNEKLQSHYNKYGKSDLQLTILLECENEDLIKMEQYFIDFYNPYFNSRKIANSNLGLKHTEESKKKMSMSRKGKKRIFSEEHKKNLSKALIGNKNGIKINGYSEETKRKISESKKGKPSGMLGKKHSDETRKKMSESAKGRIFTNEHKKNLSIAHFNYYKELKNTM